MDFTSVWENVSGANPMFLAATGSVALGVTLVLAAGVVHLRRARCRLRTPEPVAAEDATATLPAGAPVEEIPVPAAVRPSIPENPELHHLLARLRAAADRLEGCRMPAAGMPVSRTDSRLKSHPSGVDYIFRAGKG